MEIIVHKKINPTTQISIKFDGERDIKEALLKATPFMGLKGECGLCHSDQVDLQARQTKNGQYIYIEMVCRKCGAQQQFGEYKTPKGALFLKRWSKRQMEGAGE